MSRPPGFVATSEGIKVVLTGSVAKDGGGFLLTGRAIDSVSGKDLGNAKADAVDKASVLGGVQRVASKLRDDLGDTTLESVPDRR